MRGNVAPTWQIAAGALEYAETDDEASIILPYTKHASDSERDPDRWDAAIVFRNIPDLPIPQVCTSAQAADTDLRVVVDEREISSLVLNQFLSIGLKHVAFVGPSVVELTNLRWEYFGETAKARGVEPTLIYLDKNPMETLSSIPKPCGVMAVNDRLGLRFMGLCKEAGVRIPGEVSVIGVDNTPGCLQSSPTLSSVVHAFPLIGFHAARMCAELVRGKTVESMEVPPSGLILRGSVTEPGSEMNTAAAIAHFLRMNIDQPIEMEDLLRQSNLSRRWLEKLFKAAYGGSPMAYLKELRLSRAKHMLTSGDATLKEVAKSSGYRDVNHLCRIFRQHLGTTPLKFREDG